MTAQMDTLAQRVTKAQAAERQLVCAINLFFANGDAVAVHTLASAAQEIITALCRWREVKSFFDDILADNPDLTQRRLRDLANRYRNFFKHADRDPEAVVEEFGDNANDALLFVACHDFGRLCSGMATEMQVFEAWYLACNPQKLREPSLAIAQLFPGIADVPRFESKRRGAMALEWAKSQPTLQMQYRTEWTGAR